MPDDWEGYPLRKDYPVQIEMTPRTTEPLQVTEEEFRANIAKDRLRDGSERAGTRRSVDDHRAARARSTRRPIAAADRRRGGGDRRGARAAAASCCVFGNGGSAADAQHVAAELVGRFQRERAALAAMALTTDTSVLTSIAQRLRVRAGVRAADRGARHGRATSRSASARAAGRPNVVAALDAARQRGLRTIALTGRDGGAVGRGRRRFTSTCRPTSTRARPGSASHAAARDLRARGAAGVDAEHGDGR